MNKKIATVCPIFFARSAVNNNCLLIRNRTSAPLGAWKCYFIAYLENYDRPNNQPILKPRSDRPNDKPTNRLKYTVTLTMTDSKYDIDKQY